MAAARNIKQEEGKNHTRYLPRKWHSFFNPFGRRKPRRKACDKFTGCAVRSTTCKRSISIKSGDELRPVFVLKNIKDVEDRDGRRSAVIKKVTANKRNAKSFLIRAGIVDRSGNLTERYK